MQIKSPATGNPAVPHAATGCACGPPARCREHPRNPRLISSGEKRPATRRTDHHRGAGIGSTRNRSRIRRSAERVVACVTPIGVAAPQPGGLVATDASVARGGGGVVQDGTRLIRPSQDCSSVYGRALLFNEISSIDADCYQERTICRIDAEWMPGLSAVHSYSRAGDWEAIDGGFRTVLRRRRKVA